MSAQSTVIYVGLELVLTIQMGISTCVNVKMEQCLELTQTTFLHALVCFRMGVAKHLMVGLYLKYISRCLLFKPIRICMCIFLLFTKMHI